MEESTANRKQAENEVVFRSFNEHMNKGIAHLKQIAEEEEQFTDLPDTKKPRYFCCECADENCRDRIRMSPDLYTKLHKKHNAFVIIPGHAVAEIERVVLHKKDYEVVEKYIEPPEHVSKLHITNLYIKKPKA